MMIGTQRVINNFFAYFQNNFNFANSKLFTNFYTNVPNERTNIVNNYNKVNIFGGGATLLSQYWSDTFLF